MRRYCSDDSNPHRDPAIQRSSAALVNAVRAAVGGAAIRAETDDDAVGFYRRLGFAITMRDPDPRWPGRQRYDCLLPAAASASAAGRARSSG